MALPSVIGKQDGASIKDFMNSIAVVCDDERMSVVCGKLTHELHMSGVYDIGTFKTMNSATLKDCLANVDAEQSMQRLLENAMGHTFKLLETSNVAFRTEKPKQSGLRVSKYVLPGEKMIGDEMRMMGTLSSVRLPDSLFKMVKTPNPLVRAISYKDSSALHNAVFVYVMLKFGVVNIDEPFKEELAKQIRLRCPFPAVTNGGEQKKYETSLQYIFANKRAQNKPVNAAPVCAAHHTPCAL